MKLNNFEEDLKFSHKMEDWSIWIEIYNKAFPNNHGFTNERENGQTQHLGIDRTVILSSGKAIYIDEKVRRKDYGDILLEFVSNDRTKSKGWAEKPLFCDYIAYAIIESGMCYLLPVPQLQKVWAENKEEWLKGYGIKSAPNQYYNTLNCPIPIKVLFQAIGNALRISFKGEKCHSNYVHIRKSL